jgi:hypothetical protein
MDGVGLQCRWSLGFQAVTSACPSPHYSIDDNINNIKTNLDMSIDVTQHQQRFARIRDRRR